METDSLTEKEARAYQAEAHYRLTWPLFNLMLPLAAAAILFSGYFNRRGQGQRTIGAAIAMTAIVLFYFTLRSLGMQYAWVQLLQYGLILMVCLVALRVIAREAFIALPTIRFSLRSARQES